MIYVCVVAHNNAPTVGLVLWKVRQVLAPEPWEYHLLVANDGSTDGTAEQLDLYQRALPMTVAHHAHRRGYAASIEALLREAVARTDRPRRDAAVTLPADFAISPAVLPDLLKRLASGADLVVAESLDGRRSIGARLVRRWAPWLLRPGLNLPGLRDLTSGAYAVRLSTLKPCFQHYAAPLLQTEGPCANAELLARAASNARQIAAVPASRGPTPAVSPHDERAIATAVALFRAGRRLKIPTPAARVQRA